MALTFKPSVEMRATGELQALLNAGKITGRSVEFAASLIASAKIRSLSEKQALWVDKLIDEAKGAETKPQGPKITGLEPLIAMFDHAKQHKKYPKVHVDVDGFKLKLSLASDTAKVPGSITVVVGNAWVGRVRRDGTVEFNYDGKQLGQPLIDAIARFAAQPHVVAKEHGDANHWCCFCQIELTHPISKEMGYGPICAKKFGLPWSKKEGADEIKE